VDDHAMPDPTIDLNADVGELPGLRADGSEVRLIARVSSVNIACGGHAGDAESMRATCRAAIEAGAAIGAHPGYPDRADFGRRVMTIAPEALRDSIRTQVADLEAIARELGAELAHVKPHGALYNAAVGDAALAGLIGEALVRRTGRLRLVGLAGSPMLDRWRTQGHRVAGEAFADRRYEADGRLRDRRHADALIHDPDEAARQAVRIAVERTVMAIDGSVVPCPAETIGLHGDAAGAEARVNAVRRALEAAGVRIAPPG
jgi:UPF0271 protein